MSIALYRRYRPETFDEVVGQEHVTVPLMAALEADRTNHAYLFSGPRGCGKTTSARILARCLNCAEGPTATPCGECESCIELSRGGTGSLDVVEMDAASHGGVDDARELRERASFAPLRDRYKVFIIDEAHMVSNQGFNALLKLVEEPPPHVKFIFATTEPDKVIGTIRSRTHHYPFRLVPPGILEDYLADLATQEDIEVRAGVLPLVVRAGTGSVRDSLSVLDQLIGGATDGVLDYQTAVSLLGYTDGALLDAAVNAIADVNGEALFGAVADVVESGHDPRRFVEDLLDRLRDLVVIALAGDSAKDVLSTVPEDQLGRMREQAERIGAARATACADLTNSALSDMVGATSPRLQLELLCARLLLASDSATPAVSSSPAASGADLADIRAAARSFGKKREPRPESNQQERPPAPPVQAAPPASEPAQQAPERLVPPREESPSPTPAETSPQDQAEEQASRQDQAPSGEHSSTRGEARSENASSAEADGTRAHPPTPPVTPQEPEISDKEMLAVLRGLWREAMADPRVPKGTSDFIRHREGAVSVVGGVVHVDFKTKNFADAFTGEGRAVGLEVVFSEKLGKPLTVRVGVAGTHEPAGESDDREPDDAEADSQVASPATSSPERAVGSPASAPSAHPTSQSRGGSLSAVPDLSRQSASSPSQPEGQGSVAAAIARASARSGGSAMSPEESGPFGGSPTRAQSRESHPSSYQVEPSHDEDEYGLGPHSLPPDLPDIVREDFPAAPPATMPRFPAPPPREAPSTATPGAPSTSSANTFARLASHRGSPEPVEETIDVETEHELVSRDDPLALEAHGIGLSIVLEVLGGSVIEEVEEES
ncbi:DNA polymerase III subunit gamma and tau [Flaviflexus huanghaiensis]|uniref:DNA polymerase III subunit gamma and tau n=1 Tax=Flaviflexus huanghaiensis TaxID=1111473 RepID=UPI0015FDC142